MGIGKLEPGFQTFKYKFLLYTSSGVYRTTIMQLIQTLFQMVWRWRTSTWMMEHVRALHSLPWTQWAFNIIQSPPQVLTILTKVNYIFLPFPMNFCCLWRIKSNVSVWILLVSTKCSQSFRPIWNKLSHMVFHQWSLHDLLIIIFSIFVQLSLILCKWWSGSRRLRRAIIENVWITGTTSNFAEALVDG